jgi:outer membrane protein OmpA-like peptidoglycan-associated protein
MLTHIDAGKDEMQSLAERRAQAARNWLVEKGTIAAERIFVLAPKIEAEADGKKIGSRVEFSLK